VNGHKVAPYAEGNRYIRGRTGQNPTLLRRLYLGKYRCLTLLLFYLFAGSFADLFLTVIIGMNVDSLGFAPGPYCHSAGPTGLDMICPDL